MDIYYPLWYNRYEVNPMIAKFEKQKLPRHCHTSAHKYRNLQNLPHWHIEYELVFCDLGSARVTVNSEQYVLERGHCLFIESGAVHSIQSLSESIISVIKIEPRLVDTAFGENSPASPLICTALPLVDIFSELYGEINNNLRFGSVVSDCIVIKALALIFRGCEMRIRHKNGANERFKELLRLIEERFHDISFAEAADFMCYSKPYFSRYFAGITGMSFSSYLNIIRIAEAVSMLESGKMSVTEIAHATGFGTIRHFNRVFKELTGHSPSSLPGDFVLIRYRKALSTEEFDPTLSSAAIM